ncbi:L-lactate dehydrogenase 1 [Corynebacterium capitovis DSM 44611]|uniref:L-lactate dehydrogenase n=1 Tax=Corynebacterium capitovis TaxID=131081 RepID=UPI0003771E18|nr:L-lactate dehydrogenase [Corynebacterium capitovis]WKD57863.1 L-lactate dehydrogenase 1 [Corynebacterium capitovis DSM 44611]
MTEITRGNKVVLIGAGDVGAAFAYAAVNRGLCDQLVIIDLDTKRAWGHAEDLNHAVPWTGHNTRVSVGDYDDCRDAAIVVNCAGVAQHEGETRLELVGRNVSIFESINTSVRESGFNGVYVAATNPVDILSYVSWKQLELPSNRIVGSGTVLDTARWRYNLSRYFGMSPSSIHTYIIGEHGDSELAATAYATLAGLPLSKWIADRSRTNPNVAAEIDQLFADTRDSAYKIIEAKGSTSFGIGAGLVRIVSAILKDEQVALPVSTLLSGEYGQDGIYIGVPAVLGRGGVEQVIELQLDDDERRRFRQSADALRAVMDSAGL